MGDVLPLQGSKIFGRLSHHPIRGTMIQHKSMAKMGKLWESQRSPCQGALLKKYRKKGVEKNTNNEMPSNPSPIDKVMTCWFISSSCRFRSMMTIETMRMAIHHQDATKRNTTERGQAIKLNGYSQTAKTPAKPGHDVSREHLQN